jgi:GMP synthase-like glutamine amidotransferase
VRERGTGYVHARLPLCLSGDGILICFPKPGVSLTVRFGNEQERIKTAAPKAIILSGGPNSVHVEGAPNVPEGFFEYCEELSIPVLGICYGMQLIVQVCGA